MKYRMMSGWVLVLFLFVSGCISAPVVPPIGLIYTGYTAPLDLDQSGTPVSQKEGRASTYSVLGLVAWGDGSVEAAARSGGIQTIESADYEYFHVLGVFHRYTTIVYGE